MIGCALSTMLCVVAGRWLWRVQRDRTQTWALGLGMLGVLLAVLLANGGGLKGNTLLVIAAVLVLQLVCLSVVLLLRALRFPATPGGWLRCARGVANNASAAAKCFAKTEASSWRA